MMRFSALLKSILVATTLLTVSMAPVAQANDVEMETIPHDASKTVLKYGVCRIVTNRTGQPILVPLGSIDEWFGGSSFVRWGPEFPNVSLAACMPGGGSDASMCKTARFADSYMYSGAGDNCGSMTFKVTKQSSFLPITPEDGAEWSRAIEWANDNLGKPASARPSDILPACYTNSNMDKVSDDDSGYIPDGSAYCISRRYQSFYISSSDGGHDSGAAYNYWRVWRP